MKPLSSRSLPFLLALLALFPASLSAISVFDVIRLSQQKYSDAEIIRIIQATDSRFVLTAEDTNRLTKEGVTEPVIREMLSRPAREKAEAKAVKPSAKTARPQSAARSTRKEAKESLPETRVPPPDPATIFDEIVRLTKSGLSDETVLAYTKAHRGDLPSEISADRLRRLHESGVSDAVVRYLTAIDVRASDEGAEEETVETYDESGETLSRSAPAYSPPSYDYDGGAYDTSYYGGGDYGGYPASDYASYYGDYPFYGDYFYPYPIYFFVNRGDFFRRFHRRDVFRRHTGDIGHRRFPGRRDFPRDRQALNRLDREPWRTRPALARGSFAPSFRDPRTLAMNRGLPGRPMIPPRGFGQVSRRPMGGFAGPRGPAGPVALRGPAFSGGPHLGASISRAPIGRSGGGPSFGGRPSVAPRR